MGQTENCVAEAVSANSASSFLGFPGLSVTVFSSFLEIFGCLEFSWISGSLGYRFLEFSRVFVGGFGASNFLGFPGLLVTVLSSFL